MTKIQAAVSYTCKLVSYMQVLTVTEAKSHILAKLSPLFGQRWQRFGQKCIFGQNIFNMSPAQGFA